MKDSVVITAANRTAVELGKSLKNTPAYELGSAVISETIKNSKVHKRKLMK